MFVHFISMFQKCSLLFPTSAVPLCFLLAEHLMIIIFSFLIIGLLFLAFFVVLFIRWKPYDNSPLPKSVWKSFIQQFISLWYFSVYCVLITKLINKSLHSRRRKRLHDGNSTGMWTCVKQCYRCSYRDGLQNHMGKEEEVEETRQKLAQAKEEVRHELSLYRLANWFLCRQCDEKWIILGEKTHWAKIGNYELSQ